MKSCLKKITSILSSVAFTTSVFALTSQKNIQNDSTFLSDFVSRVWSTAEGLPGNTVNSLMQDSTGYLYIGTYDGLVRFDGIDFETINRNIDKKYDFMSARSIFQDSNKNIWVGSNDEGITCIKADKTTLNFSMTNGLPNNSIRAICEDKNGNIWVGTAAGLVYLKNKNDNWTIEKPSGLEEFGESNILVSRLYCDTAGRVWITSNKKNGTYIYTNKTFARYDKITKIENPIINVVTQDFSGNFWFGVEPHYLVKTNNSEEEIFDISFDKYQSIYINKIYQDKNANIWVATDRGITIYHNGRFSHFNKTNGLSDDKVADLIEDREGNIWLATDRSGIEKFSLSKFKTTPMNTSINAICEDLDRNVTWLGGDDGLYCVKNGQFVENEITQKYKNDRIRHIEYTKNKNLLISSYEKFGQIIIDKFGNTKSIKEEDGLSGRKVRVAIESSDGSIFVGTTTGLNIIDKSGKITKITKENGIVNDYIMCIYEDFNGTIWCGTDGGGIFSLKKEDNDYKIQNSYTTNDGLSGNVIFKICEMNGNLWVCTGTGISRIKFDTTSKSKIEVFNLNTANGLGTSGVFQLLPDYTGTVWMTSNRGIFNAKLEDMDSCADGKKSLLPIRYFGKSDGLTSEGTTSTSLSMKDSLGRIWFTLIDGYAIYDPVKITANRTEPIVKVMEVTIDNEKMTWDGNPIILKPNVKRFGLKYTGLSFATPEQMQFSNKLEGFDKDFSEWTNSRTVSYTNLKHGTYNFSVIAKNGDDISSKPSETITIIKEPYIWELWGFWVTIAILVIGTTGLIVFLRFRTLKMQKIFLEQKVEERTHELKLEKERSESLLLNILPKDIADELSQTQEKNENKTISRKYPNVTVLFTDIVGFTKMSDGLSAETVVKMLNSLFTRFDIRAEKEGIEKIKTIGDSYMAASGLTEADNNDGAIKMVKYAIGILQDLKNFNENSDIKVSIRVGINTGNLVAGVIGKTKFIYDIWGDTVNTASRMESSGTPLQIHVSESTYNATKSQFNYSSPVEVEVKGKGLMSTFYLINN